jgi:hypothetical protein
MEKGVIVKLKTSHDAFEWFAMNDSGALEQAANWPLWNAWRHTPGNKAKYVEALDLIEQLRKLPPPVAASREELVQDAALDESGGTKPH